ncbi:hypothetical protein B0T10DRAFT_486558 [Thelonectria olida]|uniref:Uncharacterized protein n=1 Tax=Thelonectria olida TaxID=1576542 RepID=A0A9P9AQF5_9HYPO|nr:hypothetical protein B0T10DRAFT_486558 [Thelonectria olida]
MSLRLADCYYLLGRRIFLGARQPLHRAPATCLWLFLFALPGRIQRSLLDGAHKSSYLGLRHTLFQLCLVSRRLRNVAQPIMYHEFLLGYGDSKTIWKCSGDRRLTSFIRTVASRRDI